MRKKTALILLLLFVGVACAQTTDVTALDPVVEQAMKAFHVPGVGVGIIQNGKIVLAKGYGLRDVKRNLPVTVHTRFAVGSITKSFTTAVAAMLVDEGKLEWDRPVREYLPWFRLQDPVATQLMTTRDLLTHRSGLPLHDFIRFAVPLEREELVRRLAYLEPSKSFRSTYQYNNLMYVAAGYLEGVITHSNWEQLVNERIFVPLKLAESNTSVLDSQKTGDFAKPYLLKKEAAEESPFYVYQKFGVGPNGAVNSTVEDMLKYLEFQMGDGKANGKQLISAAGMREMHSPQMVIPAGPFPEFDLMSYGLGWRVGTYRGHKIIDHSGSITGFQAWIGFFPHDKLGLVVLSNTGAGLPGAVSLSLADRLLGLEPVDWTARLSRPPVERKPTPQQPNTRPSHDLKDYAGEYRHPAYGVIRVEAQGEGLNVVFPARELKLKHYHYDVFQADGGLLLQFQLDGGGNIESVAVPVEPAVKPAIFTRTRGKS